MALYVIGDLHLGLGVSKPMDIFGDGWSDHTQRILDGFAKLTEDDLTVLAGDSTWGISLTEALPDFTFIDQLPGKKLLLKGNHDYWWETATKSKRFFDTHGITTLDILHNNAFVHGEFAVCGTRGWFFEEARNTQNEKIYQRELLRLEASLRTAKELNRAHIIACLHYPPLCMGFECTEITDLLAAYGVRDCYFGHLHGSGHKLAFQGEHKGVQYRLVSADFLGFTPVCVPEN